MALGDLQGHGRTSIRSPEALGCCDSCGFLYPLSSLARQMQWAGTGLIWTGYLVCKNKCLDKPFEQLRTLILPPDPVPRLNPRPDPNVTAPWPIGVLAGPTSPGNLGLTQYVLGDPIPGSYPTTKAAVLAQIATLTGIPTPAGRQRGIVDRSISFAEANVSTTVMAANPSRAWLLVYSPVQPFAQMALGASVALGGLNNLGIGPGEAWFQAVAQGLGPEYNGAIAALGSVANMPLFSWEA